MQRFLIKGKQQANLWHRYQKLGTHSVLGAMLIVAVSSVSKTTVLAALLTDWQFASVVNQSESSSLIAQTPATVTPPANTLPPANFPINQGGSVNVPPVNPPKTLTPTAPTPAMPPAVSPSADVPTNQTPSVNIPTLQPTPAETPTPVTTSQPLKQPTESMSPNLSSPPVIEFGQPLPKTTSTESVLKP